MRVNKLEAAPETHEGGKASRLNAEQMLRRTVMACLLWESTFYEDGESIIDRIKRLVPEVGPELVAEMAIEARSAMKLRHVPLLLCRELARIGKLKAQTLADVIQRADELAEFTALYWLDGRCPLSAQVKKGLAAAFPKFSAYQLAKYDRPGKVRLRDVLFLSHAKPKDSEQQAIWEKLIAGTLEPPDTWEVALSSGADKKAAWERLVAEDKLGGLATLRNLRNMERAGIGGETIRGAIAAIDPARILPYRFIAAARYAPRYEPDLEAKFIESMGSADRLPGKTILMVDVSGSMDWAMSGQSEMTRMDAACSLAMILREVCAEIEICSFSDQAVLVPARRGFALRDVLIQSQPHGGTYLGQAIKTHRDWLSGEGARIIVITDEQIADRIPAPPAKRGYIINLCTDENGVGYGSWLHINGFSEATVAYISALERAKGFGK